MLFGRNRIHTAACLAAILCLALVCGCRKKKYEDPITKKTDQPDKVLFDRAVGDIEHGRYEVARITLNTLINTYDTSEYLAKAKLAIADSWYREGGSHGWAQAEAEYKDFKLFYPTMEEAAESQEKICLIHYKQMEKPDRDRQQAIRAEDECRELLVEYPNSKFAPQAQQMLRNIQEVLASGEYLTGMFYRSKGSFPAAANRLQYAVDQYPLFSQADEALWQLADSYLKMGDRFEDKAATAYAHIVKDYPLSDRADDAAQKLKDMNRPVPEADPVAYARMKYEIDNRQKESMRNRVLDAFRHSPDTHAAAKSGSPAMAANRPTIPMSVPASLNAPSAPGSGSGTGVGGGASDVTVQTVSNSTALDTKPDARQNPPVAGATPLVDGSPNGPAANGAPASGAAARDAAAPGDASAKPAADPATAAVQALPMNHQPLKKKKTKKQAQAEALQQQQKQQQQQAQPAAAQQPAAQQPPSPQPPPPQQQ
jgi:outer membrane protein assembly factor BamD